MKTRYFVLLVFSAILLGTNLIIPDASAYCKNKSDWPDRPCHAFPGYERNIEQEGLEWESYYDSKGAEWMESKKQEMIHAIQNETLSEWIQLTHETGANSNVHEYYSSIGIAVIDKDWSVRIVNFILVGIIIIESSFVIVFIIRRKNEN